MKNADMPSMPVEMSMTNDGPQALQTGSSRYMSLGLTKREMFAMAAMQGIMANHGCQPSRQAHFQNIAGDAVVAADALLAELEIQS